MTDSPAIATSRPQHGIDLMEQVTAHQLQRIGLGYGVTAALFLECGVQILPRARQVRAVCAGLRVFHRECHNLRLCGACQEWAATLRPAKP